MVPNVTFRGAPLLARPLDRPAGGGRLSINVSRYRPQWPEPVDDIFGNLLPPRLGHDPVGVILEFLVGRYCLVLPRHSADDRCTCDTVLGTGNHHHGGRSRWTHQHLIHPLSRRATSRSRTPPSLIHRRTCRRFPSVPSPIAGAASNRPLPPNVWHIGYFSDIFSFRLFYL